MTTKMKTRGATCDAQVATVGSARGGNMLNLKTTVFAYIVEQRTAKHTRMEKKHAELMQEILQHIMQHSMQHMRMGKNEKSEDARNNITKEKKDC